MNACLVPICSLHGQAVTTVEGIGSLRKGLHPVQVGVLSSSKSLTLKHISGHVSIFIHILLAGYRSCMRFFFHCPLVTHVEHNATCPFCSIPVRFLFSVAFPYRNAWQSSMEVNAASVPPGS